MNFRNQTFTGEFSKRKVNWNVGKVIDWIMERELRPQSIPVRLLQKQLDACKTDEPTGSFMFKMRAIAADLHFPIITTEEDEQLWVVDGIHRLWKAKMLGNSEIIQGYVFPAEALPNLL